jgi:toxin ParE1/3/4
MKVRWSARSIRDLESISRFIGMDNPSAAARQCALIFDATERLRSFPRSGQKTLSADRFVLTVPRTSYLIYYRVDDDVIHIVTIRHGARKQ